VEGRLRAGRGWRIGSRLKPLLPADPAPRRVGKAQRAHADKIPSPLRADAKNGGHGLAAFAHPTARFQNGG
jgi:hypothetical protein